MKRTKMSPEAEKARREAVRRYREDMLDLTRQTRWLERLEDERTAGRRLPEEAVEDANDET